MWVAPVEVISTRFMPDGQPIPASQFLVYAGIFRLAIVGGGIACMVLGYRLLSQAISPKHRSEGSLEGSVGSAQFAIRNVAPGTMFAAFGMIVVAIMLYEGMPELTQQRGSDSFVLRSDGSSQTPDLAALTERALKLEQAGNVVAATEVYEEALDRVATPATQLASIYLQQNRNGEALALARLAADLRPYRANVLDTLAVAYERTGNHAAALQAAEKAAALDAQYNDKLEALRRGR